MCYVVQLSVDYIADQTAAEERIRMYARFWVYTQISVDLVSTKPISVAYFWNSYCEENAFIKLTCVKRTKQKGAVLL